jgi:hypothetical protein
VAKRIKMAMVDFAKRVGAMRNGRPDWYGVAERLAEISKPELVAKDGATTRGPGRPKNDDDFLAMEVHRVMWAFDVGVREACRRISLGRKVPIRKVHGRPPGRWATHGSPWKDKHAGTLEQRYFRWLKGEKKRQQKLTIEIK